MDKVAYSKDCDGLAPAAPSQHERAGTVEFAPKTPHGEVNRPDEAEDD